MTLAAVVLLASVSLGFAHGGYGGGQGGGGQYMMGGGMMGPGMMGGNYGAYMHGGGYGYGDVSKEDWSKLQTLRDDFFKATKDLRVRVGEQQLALQTELIKETPDTEIVAQIQKTLSQLRADFDQKSLSHQLEIRKVMPQSARGDYGGGFGGYCR